MVSFLSGTLLLLCALLLYIVTEQSAFVHSQNRETIFWLLFITSAAALLVFASDSPIRRVLSSIFADETNFLQVAVVLIIVPITAGFLLSRNKINQLVQAHATHQFSRRASLHAKRQIQTSARFKQSDVDDLLERLSYSSHLRFFVSYLMGRVQERRDKIRNIFQSSSLEELNHLLMTTNVAKLLHFADLDLFSAHDNAILKHLSVASKATIIHSLMRVQGLFHPKQRELVVALFQSEQTREGLLALKNKLDASGDAHNLYKLVYGDFGNDPELQGKLLAHIQEVGGGTGGPIAGFKILSDIDDTFFSSGGRWPAGVDKVWPRHILYPGVLTFYEEIDKHGAHLASKQPNTVTPSASPGPSTDAEETGPDGFLIAVDLLNEQVELDITPATTLGELSSRIDTEYLVPHWRQRWSVTPQSSRRDSRAGGNVQQQQNLVFLSARPHAYKDFTESASYASFRTLYERGRLHTRPTLLPGDLRVGARVIWEDISGRIQAAMYDGRALLSALLLVADRKLGKNKNVISPAIKTMLEKWASSEPGDAVDELEKKGNSMWEPVGRQKSASFVNFCALYPESVFCFVGDDGQGDVLAAEVVSQKLGRDALQMSFIHRVANDKDTILSTFDAGERESKWKEMGLYFFSTYVDAAATALELGVIQARGAYRVGVAARDEMLEYMIDQPEFDWSKHIAALNKDIERCNEVLRKKVVGNSKALVIPMVEGKKRG